MAITQYTPEQIRNAVNHFDRHLSHLADEDQPHAKILIAATEQHLVHQERSQRLIAAAQRFTNAIRRFTVEAPNDKPNGPVEEAIVGLLNSLSKSSYVAFGPRAFNIANGWGAKLCQALADDTKELREAADAYFGGDFTKPNETTQETTP